MIASENASSVTLRNTAGDVEIKKEDIATRENTRRSLMPEGFESLGAEALRDILSFIVSSGDGAIRIPRPRPARRLHRRQPARVAAGGRA